MAIALAAGVGWAETEPARNARPARPNVIVMMADDMGMGDSSAYQDVTGNDDSVQIATPSMERLARMGIRFTDAHASSTRCTNTRYGLLTGRYAWRNRMKWWVLFGAQGDPMIEADRPTLATLFRDHGYGTAMVGKWHVGLRYRTATGTPAAGFEDADLTQPMFDTPLDHGFDRCWITSRSHGTSGPQPETRKNRPDQTVGPGHVEGRRVLSASGEGRKLVDDGPHAYVLSQLGGRHSDHAIGFLQEHLSAGESRERPFFLFYACNSNHAPYTPDEEIGGEPVSGSGRSVSGQPLGSRADFVYENDVALGRLLDYLATHDDPRQPGAKLIDNTVVIFTSDNGAEITERSATGPFRSNKGSVYEGGHRVPFLVAWPRGGIGDGRGDTPGLTGDAPFGLHDLFATFAEVLKADLPDVRAGEKGAEDSRSVLAAWRGESLSQGYPIFHNDHKEADDPAAAALRVDDPVVEGRSVPGQWKLFFDASLLRFGVPQPTELYDLGSDPEETRNRIGEAKLQPLVAELSRIAVRHRTAGGHRLAEVAGERRISFRWRSEGPGVDPAAESVDLSARFHQATVDALEAVAGSGTDAVRMRVGGSAGDEPSSQELRFDVNPRGLGIGGGRFDQVDQGEAISISFDRDVLVESLAVVAGNGQCGGFYRVGDGAPLAIYCVDADNDRRDQSGRLSDIGVLPAGEILRLDSSPHYGTEPAGQWRLGEITVRTLRP